MSDTANEFFQNCVVSPRKITIFYTNYFALLELAEHSCNNRNINHDISQYMIRKRFCVQSFLILASFIYYFLSKLFVCLIIFHFIISKTTLFLLNVFMK